MKSSNRVEWIAIPIVAVIFGVGAILLIASVAGAWAWIFVGAAGLLLAAVLVARFTRRHPHPASAQPAPATGSPARGAPYRILVIADESCVDPSFATELARHGAGRTVEALVIAPAIGSRLSRWTGDETQYADARKHLDDTAAALAAAGISAHGETGADDPLQAADDGLRKFAADEVVFVTKEGTETDWVEQGVVEAARARYQIQVTQIVLGPDR